MTIFFKVLITLFVGGLTLSAQQEGSVSIASAIRSEQDMATTTQNFTNCVSRLVEVGLPVKDAAKECKDVAKIVAETTKRVANEAADATKASRPLVVMSPYGRRYYRGMGVGVVVGGGSRVYQRPYRPSRSQWRKKR